MKDLKIVILGHGVGVKFCIEALKESSLGAVVAIFTHPIEQHASDLEMIRKRKDLYGEYAYNIFNAEADYQIPVIQAENVNEPEVVNKIASFKPDYVVSVGCRNIIKKPFLDTFPDRVINLHTLPLPKFRGAAGDTWMILNGLQGTTQFGCCHYINVGIDSGNIIAKRNFDIPEKAYPIDVYKSRISTIGHLLIDALQKLESPNLTTEVQDINEATVFPRLFTPRDAKIDFSLFGGKDIERFIFGFGYPFSGAFCFLDDKRISILEAEYIPAEPFHAFCNGLIFGKTAEGQYKVAVKDGYLVIKKIEIDEVVTEQPKVFRLGKYLK